MKFALVLACLALAACSSGPCGASIPAPPDVGLHWPLTFDAPPQTVASPRMLVVPSYQYAVPSYSPAPGACSCGGLPPGYAVQAAPPPGAAPCAPGVVAH